jgi:hypothetical protein
MDFTFFIGFIGYFKMKLDPANSRQLREAFHILQNKEELIPAVFPERAGSGYVHPEITAGLKQLAGNNPLSIVVPINAHSPQFRHFHRVSLTPDPTQDCITIGQFDREAAHQHPSNRQLILDLSGTLGLGNNSISGITAKGHLGPQPISSANGTTAVGFMHFTWGLLQTLAVSIVGGNFKVITRHDGKPTPHQVIDHTLPSSLPASFGQGLETLTGVIKRWGSY